MVTKKPTDNVTNISGAKRRPASALDKATAHFASLPPEYQVSAAMLQNAADNAKIADDGQVPADGYAPLDAMFKWFPSLREYAVHLVWDSMHRVLQKGAAIAVGRPDNPHAEVIAIPPDAWRWLKLQPKNIYDCHAKDEQGALYYQIRIFPADRLPKKYQKNKGGRPQEHDWEKAAAAALEFVRARGLPKTQQRLVDLMTEWFEKNEGKVPADRAVQRYVKEHFYS